MGIKLMTIAMLLLNAGQDMPNNTWKSMENVNADKDSGHCGHCIVCHIWFSNKISLKSERLFSDLNILLFRCNRFGTRWITSKSILTSAGLI